MGRNGKALEKQSTTADIFLPLHTSNAAEASQKQMKRIRNLYRFKSKCRGLYIQI